MNREVRDSGENPYANGSDNNRVYEWNPQGKRLAVACRILSFSCMPVLWLVLGFFMIWRLLAPGIVTFGGILWMFVAVLILIGGLVVFVNNLFVRLSRALPAEGRHDFLLYRYRYLFKRNKKSRAEVLLAMAGLDLDMHRLHAAEQALGEIDTETLTVRQLKLYDFLEMAVSLLTGDDVNLSVAGSPSEDNVNPSAAGSPSEDNVNPRAAGSQAETWYIRFIGIKEGAGRFPDENTIRSWFRRSGQNRQDGEGREELYADVVRAAANAREESKAAGFPALIFGAMLAHCVFYPAARSCLRAGWHLQPDYNMVAGLLAGLFVLVLGIWVLYRFLRAVKKQHGPAKGGRLVRQVTASILWIFFLVMCAGIVTFELFFLGEERIIARGIPDAYTNKGRKYDYIAVDGVYGGTHYYRAMDPIFMEEWSEAGGYDQNAADTGISAESDAAALDDTESSDEMGGSIETDSAGDMGSSVEAGNPVGGDEQNPESGSDSMESSTASAETDDGFGAQNAMQRVYTYLRESGEYPDSDLTFSANAKGDMYAVIYSGSEDKDGSAVPFELGLYDNGEKEEGGERQWEIVLEKVYPSGDYETELLGFYLVNEETGKVTDEHKTSW